MNAKHTTLLMFLLKKNKQIIITTINNKFRL